MRKKKHKSQNLNLQKISKIRLKGLLSFRSIGLFYKKSMQYKKCILTQLMFYSKSISTVTYDFIACYTLTTLCLNVKQYVKQYGLKGLNCLCDQLACFIKKSMQYKNIYLHN